jgi:hypothetical protein
MNLIEEKQIEIGGKTLKISKVPATAGRKIFTQYLPTATPKIGNYEENEKLMYELISYTSVKTSSGDFIRLSAKEIIDNHLNWQELMKLEAAMGHYNCDFFRDGRALIFFDGIAQKLPAWILKMLTGLLEQLSQAEKPPSTN